MSNESMKQLIRFVIIVLVQGLILRRVEFGGVMSQYFAIIFYPVFIMLLPMKTSRIALVFTGFATGIIIDLFYDSLGVHASAALFMAFIRPYVLLLFEPRGGYSANTDPNPRGFGMTTFLQYAAVMLIAHLLFYFSVEVFTFAHTGQILLKTISSFVLSYASIVLYVFLFNPR